MFLRGDLRVIVIWMDSIKFVFFFLEFGVGYVGFILEDCRYGELLFVYIGLCVGCII